MFKTSSGTDFRSGEARTEARLGDMTGALLEMKGHPSGALEGCALGLVYSLEILGVKGGSG